jgi:tRNA(Ile)-lysidine synthase
VTCADALARRLNTAPGAPIAVGFSGGGDSLAALIVTKAWADRARRPVLALCVDHGLQPQSADWTAFAGEAATRLGAGFRALRWTGEKPSHGLPAAARTARHRLVAEAAREAGAKVIVLGHTADDVLEADVMRGWGARMGWLREWSPSPVWPEGRGLFILRPLLGVRRAALRDSLAARGEQWIDDPANTDPRQLRARARSAIDGGGAAGVAADDGGAADLADETVGGPDASLILPRAFLRAAPDGAARRFLAAALSSAGGSAGPPRSDRLAALQARLVDMLPLHATLCGARVVADDQVVTITREPGRGRAVAVELPQHEPIVWDGRFELCAAESGLSVRALGGLAARLPSAERAALRSLPPEARPVLPAIVRPDGGVTSPVLARGPATARALAHDRVRAACGAISKEPAT